MATPSKFGAMREMRLLLSNSVRRRCSLGKPSSREIALSVRSMLSNWFCTATGSACHRLQAATWPQTEGFLCLSPRTKCSGFPDSMHGRASG